MAAIIGISIGKPTLKGRFIEGTKSIAGCVAMFITSSICTFVSLLLLSSIAWYVILPMALVIGVACTFTELFTKKGFDTITVPLVAAVLLILSVEWSWSILAILRIFLVEVRTLLVLIVLFVVGAVSCFLV